MESVVESAIKASESALLDSLDQKFETISGIDEVNKIEAAISTGILSANESYHCDSTDSWNKATAKSVFANVVSKGLKKTISETGTDALSNPIEDAFISMSLTVSNIMADALKEEFNKNPHLLLPDIRSVCYF